MKAETDTERIFSVDCQIPVSQQYQSLAPDRIIQEDTRNHISFNVMPDRPVEETLFIKEYRIWPNYMETVFDRQYKSSMIHSPDHLIFLSLLVTCQKSMYVYVCNALGIPYGPRDPERVKIWPIDVKVVLPKMVRTKNNLVHSIRFSPLRKVDEGKYHVAIQSHVEGIIQLDGEALIFLI